MNPCYKQVSRSYYRYTNNEEPITCILCYKRVSSSLLHLQYCTNNLIPHAHPRPNSHRSIHTLYQSQAALPVRPEIVHRWGRKKVHKWRRNASNMCHYTTGHRFFMPCAQRPYSTSASCFVCSMPATTWPGSWCSRSLGSSTMLDCLLR